MSFFSCTGGDIVKDVKDMATRPLKHVPRLTFDIQRELAVTICCPFKGSNTLTSDKEIISIFNNTGNIPPL